MKFLHLYLMKTTFESFMAIWNQKRWKHDGDRLNLYLDDSVSEITLDLSHVRSESGQKLLGLTFKHGFSRYGDEGVILLCNGIAKIPIEHDTFIYPIWGNKYYPSEDELEIIIVPHRDEIGKIVMTEFFIEAPYGHIPIFKSNSGPVIECRQIEPPFYYSLFGKKIYPVSFQKVNYEELDTPTKEAIRHRIGL